MTKGVLLYSGGLDSILVAKILMDQNIDIIGFHCVLPFVSPFLNLNELESVKRANDIGLKLEFYHCEKEYLDLVKNPPHGYGKNINPCIDCKIHFIQKAAEYMKKINGDFVATGEVVGQRPMSQMKHTLNHIEKVTDIPGRLLRPLSAKILKPTIPELEGKIDREKLYDINGRSRKRQMELAKKYDIKDFSSPAGGCLFTDPVISKRVKDLFDHNNNYEPRDMYLLTIGRHFRINDNIKIIVSRNEIENNELEKFLDHLDYSFIPDFRGPIAAIMGNANEEDIQTASAIISRYGKPDHNDNKISVFKKGKEYIDITASDSVSDNELDNMRI